MKFIFRCLGLLFLALAFVALAYDGARMLANEALTASSLKQFWQMVDRAGFDAAQVQWSAAQPALWNGVINPLLVFPAWMVLSGAGVIFYLIGYRPKPPEIISNF